MKNADKAEYSILKLWREEIQKAREDERELTLSSLSKVLCWLTMEPPLTHKKLLEWSLAELEHANKYKSSHVNSTVDHYRKVSKQFDSD